VDKKSLAIGAVAAVAAYVVVKFALSQLKGKKDDE
jgi:hypothetical protein